MTKEYIIEILSDLVDSRTGKKLSEITIIEGLSNTDGLIKLRLNIKDLQPDEKSAIRKLVEDACEKKGKDVLVSIVSESSIKPKPAPNNPAIKPLVSEEVLSCFKKKIAVYSTKGGVGKSAVAAELAIEMSQKGLKVAVVDLDVYGPSIPRILGLRGKVTIHEEKFVPAELDGIHMMSVGLLVPAMDAPLIWRAPIVNGVIAQIFSDTKWDKDYDVLILDMPPGTGDIPILVGQNITLDGVLAVTTPQGVAMEDTVKGLSMFKKFDTPLLGFVYNMGSVLCPDCNKLIPIFVPNHEFDDLLMDYGLDILAELPLDARVAKMADEGTLTELEEDSVWKQEFAKITSRMMEELDF